MGGVLSDEKENFLEANPLKLTLVQRNDVRRIQSFIAQDALRHVVGAQASLYANNPKFLDSVYRHRNLPRRMTDDPAFKVTAAQDIMNQVLLLRHLNHPEVFEQKLTQIAEDRKDLTFDDYMELTEAWTEYLRQAFPERMTERVTESYHTFLTRFYQAVCVKRIDITGT